MTRNNKLAIGDLGTLQRPSRGWASSDTLIPLTGSCLSPNALVKSWNFAFYLLVIIDSDLIPDNHEVDDSDNFPAP
jgi:hypothetical protein